MADKTADEEAEPKVHAKTISKIFKFVSAGGIILCCVLKWIGILPDADVSEICGAWAVVYGLGAGTIDANLIIDKFKS
jgi:hypothetical protein